MIVPGAPHQTRFLPQRFPCDAAMEMGVSIGIPPIAGWFIRENPMNIDDNWGYPHDLGNLQIYVWGFPGSDETEIPPGFSAQRPHPKREAASLFCNFNDMASVRNTTAEQISQNRLRWMALHFVKGVTRKLVGGIPTPLKNMKVSWNDYSQLYGKITHVPNRLLDTIK